MQEDHQFWYRTANQESNVEELHHHINLAEAVVILVPPQEEREFSKVSE